jgi:uncharacterized membrane protein (DUF485 family)
VKILLVMLLAFDLMYITYVLSKEWKKARTVKDIIVWGILLAINVIIDNIAF